MSNLSGLIEKWVIEDRVMTESLFTFLLIEKWEIYNWQINRWGLCFYIQINFGKVIRDNMEEAKGK